MKHDRSSCCYCQAEAVQECGYTCFTFINRLPETKKEYALNNMIFVSRARDLVGKENAKGRKSSSLVLAENKEEKQIGVVSKPLKLLRCGAEPHAN